MTSDAEDDVLLDVIAGWLALEDEAPAAPVDVMIVFGGSLPPTWDHAAAAVLADQVEVLVLSGGQGHTTDVLRALTGERLGTKNRAEADVIADYLRERHGLTEFVIENRSTNSGANIAMTRALLHDRGITPATVALTGDRTMQRRMDAIFRRVWAPDGVHGINRPGPDCRQWWTPSRWIPLIMGEVPRLRDTRDGYGPAGRDFLVHVDVPETVEAAFAALKDRHPGWGRPAVPS